MHLNFCLVLNNRSCRVIALQRFIQTMRAIQGALIVASSIQIILGYSQIWGLFSRLLVTCDMFVSWKCLNKFQAFICVDLLSRFFSPLGMAPVVGLVGLGLFQRGFPVVGVTQISILIVMISILLFWQMGFYWQQFMWMQYNITI